MWSFLWSGADLRREPIDARTPATPHDTTIQIIKGWTRLSVMTYVLLNVMETDLSTDGAIDALTPFDGVLRSAWMVPANLTEITDRATLNAEHLLLSYRGSERQRPSVLKLALRFDDSMNAKRNDPEVPVQSSDRLLEQLISDYNNHKSVAGIKKWQIGESTQGAMRAIMFGTTAEVRELMRTHLNFNKWEHSAFTTELLKCRRLFLNNKPSSGVELWDRLLTVSPLSQKLLMLRMLSDFNKKAKKVSHHLKREVPISYTLTCVWCCVVSTDCAGGASYSPRQMPMEHRGVG